MPATRSAIEDVYRTRYVGFRNALATFTGDYESARDVLQDAFAVALSRRSQFRGGSLEAWIWRIAVRRALDVVRGPRNVSVDGALDFLDPRIPEPDRDPELADALHELAPRRRLIVFLRYFAGLSYAEIAEACQISEGTVAATLAKARAQLARALDREGAGK